MSDYHGNRAPAEQFDSADDVVDHGHAATGWSTFGQRGSCACPCRSEGTTRWSSAMMRAGSGPKKIIIAADAGELEGDAGQVATSRRVRARNGVVVPQRIEVRDGSSEGAVFGIAWRWRARRCATASASSPRCASPPPACRARGRCPGLHRGPGEGEKWPRRSGRRDGDFDA